MIDRRQLLTAALVAPVLAAARKPPFLARGFADVTQIAPGVYATIADPSNGLQCYSNGGVIAGRDAVLIVEGHFQPAGAELEIEVARLVSRAPIRGVVDTHYHLDHTFGNAGYARQGIPILAHHQVGPLMTERYAAAKGADRAATLAPWETRLQAATDPVDRGRKKGDLERMAFFTDAIASADLALPTEPLTPDDLPRRLDLGGLTVEIEFHRGHSPTDLLIRVPERNVVFTGDLLFNGSYPVTPDADMAAWRRILDLMADSGRGTRFVPGHGPVCGIEGVRDQAALFDHLREHAERMKATGTTAEEAASRYRVPRRFDRYQILSWSLTIGGAMTGYFAQS